MKLTANEKGSLFMTVKATVYVSSTCPYCTMMTNYLDEIHVPYETINISTDPQAGQRLVETTGQMGVPQTQLNGKWILGFDQIKQLLFNRSCTIHTAEEMEKRMFPRFCIGNVAFAVMGVVLVIIELTH